MKLERYDDPKVKLSLLSLKLKNAQNLSYLSSEKIISCYLNINLSKFNPEGKFEFPGENMNQSDYGNYGDYGSTEILQHQLF